MNTRNILLLLIGIVSVLIIVFLAIGISVVRSQIQLSVSSNNEPLHEAIIIDTNIDKEDDTSVLERMHRMNEDGDAVTTQAQLEQMQQMNEQVLELTDAEKQELLERMRVMRDAS